METLKSGQLPALVTNIEVMHILSDNLEARNQESVKTDEIEEQNQKREAVKLRHRDFIEETVYNYLQYTPCAQTEIGKMPEFVQILKNPKAKTEKSENLDLADNITSSSAEFVERDENNKRDEGSGFGLTDSETLQILNHVPKEPVEIHLLIEDLPTRFNDDEQQELLQCIEKHLCTNNEALYEENYEDEQNVDEENQAYEGLADS